MSAENAWRIAREILATMPTKYLARCPMPPAFRAEVEAEAEAEELRGMLAEAERLLNSLVVLFDWRAAGCPAEIDNLPNFADFEDATRALLSRLEAKGESHE